MIPITERNAERDIDMAFRAYLGPESTETIIKAKMDETAKRGVK